MMLSRIPGWLKILFFDMNKPTDECDIVCNIRFQLDSRGDCFCCCVQNMVLRRCDMRLIKLADVFHQVGHVKSCRCRFLQAALEALLGWDWVTGGLGKLKYLVNEGSNADM